MRACHGPVRAAVGEAFTDAEIDDIVSRLAERHKARLKADPSADARAAMREAAAEMTREEVAAALMQRRLELAAQRARDDRQARLERMGGDAPSRNLVALMVGDERQGHGRSLSVDAQARALETDLWGEVERGLRASHLMDRVASWWGGNDPEFELRVAKEMARRNGGPETATGDADAEKVADIFGSALERGRRMQNDQGAWIGKLEGYVVRQNHDSLKVAGGFWRELAELRRGGPASWGALKARAAQRAYSRWRDLIGPLLHDRTFQGVDALAPEGAPDAKGLPFATAPEARERFLQKVWWDIVTGRHTLLTGMSDTGDFSPPASKARSVSASRVLHFNDAEAWMAYHRAFGSGSLGSAVISDLGRAARNTALMRTWGPAPEAAFAAERERLSIEARDRNDVVEGRALAGSKLQAAFDQLNGQASAPDSLRVATVGRAIRTNESTSKLGGMVLSAFADLPVSVQTLARAGVEFVDGYGGVFAGLTRLDGGTAKRVGELLDVGARSTAGRIASPFHSNDGFRGFQAWSMRLFYKVNGFDFWNDGLRSGVANMLSAHLGAEAEHGWANLHPGTRETLERYAIDARGWELLRRAAAPLAEDGGRKYLTFDGLDALDDGSLNGWAGHKGKAGTPQTAARAREDLALRLRALVSETVDTAVSEGRARENMMLQPKAAGHPVLTEALRMFTQFKAFPLAYVTRQLAPAAAGYAGKKPVALLAHLIVATTLFGYLSMQAKQIAKGREPRPLFDQNGEFDGRPFLAAMVQGGGLGIYGDFLFGEYNRFGGSPLATLGGPAIGDAEQMLRLFGMLRDGDETKASRKASAAMRLATSNTPFLNLWYTKAALDYAILWRLQEAVNPGWAQRHEATVKKNTGSRYWLKPTEAVQ